MGEELAPEVVALARSAVGRLAPSAAMWVDREDLEQEALLAAWLWLDGRGVDQVEPAHLVRHAWRGALDHLRAATHSRAAPVVATMSDDAWEITDSERPGEESGYREVEDVDAIAKLIARYPGPARDVEVALLMAHGCLGVELAPHYGVTPSAISLRRTAFLTWAARHRAELADA